jgi:hypothetical protein
MEQPIFLKYISNGWRWEFHVDYVELVNPLNGDRYRIAMDPYADLPFLITLQEKGARDWRHHDGL